MDVDHENCFLCGRPLGENYGDLKIEAEGGEEVLVGHICGDCADRLERIDEIHDSTPVEEEDDDA